MSIPCCRIGGCESSSGLSVLACKSSGSGEPCQSETLNFVRKREPALLGFGKLPTPCPPRVRMHIHIVARTQRRGPWEVTNSSSCRDVKPDAHIQARVRCFHFSLECGGTRRSVSCNLSTPPGRADVHFTSVLFCLHFSPVVPSPSIFVFTARNPQTRSKYLLRIGWLRCIQRSWLETTLNQNYFLPQP